MQTVCASYLLQVSSCVADVQLYTNVAVFGICILQRLHIITINCICGQSAALNYEFRASLIISLLGNFTLQHNTIVKC